MDKELSPIVAVLKQSVDDLSPSDRALVRHFALVDGDLFFCEGAAGPRLVIPKVAGDTTRTLLLSQAHEGVLHPGIEKTYANLAKGFFWFGMRQSVERYVKTCLVCQEQKSKTDRAEGFRAGHSVPPARFHTVAIDFITDLQPDAVGFDQILVAMDVLTKFVYLVPSLKTDCASVTAKRLFSSVFCIHGAPMVLQSDRDTRFCSTFFSQLMRCFNIRQAVSCAYDHRFNGIVENKNREVECLLRSVLAHYPDREFTEFLPLVAFAINSSLHSSLGCSPYYSLFGVEPSNPALFAAGVTARGTDAAAVQDLVDFQMGVLALVRDNLLGVQRAVAIYQNRKQHEVVFNVGDRVWLNSMNLSAVHFSRSERKFRNPFVGPFEVVERMSEYTYRLHLSGKLKKVHPVFHAVMLKKCVSGDDEEFAGRSQLCDEGVHTQQDVQESVLEPIHEVDEDGNDLYFVEDVLERKPVSSKGKRKKWQYLVKWRGFEAQHNSWVTSDMMVGSEASAMLKAFDEEQERLAVGQRRRSERGRS